MSRTIERNLADTLRDASMRLNNAAVLTDEATWRTVRAECERLEQIRRDVLRERAAVGSQTEAQLAAVDVLATIPVDPDAQTTQTEET